MTPDIADKIRAVVKTARSLRWFVEGIESQAEQTGRLDVQVTDEAISDVCDAIVALDGHPMRPAGRPDPEDVAIAPTGPRHPHDELIAAEQALIDAQRRVARARQSLARHTEDVRRRETLS